MLGLLAGAALSKTIHKSKSSLDAKIDGYPKISDCPENCVETVSAHGDPMLKVNGTGVHFWIKEGTLTPMLAWKHEGKSMQLIGKTFSSASTGHQWFDTLSIEEDGEAVYEAAMRDGKMTVNGKAHAHDCEETVGGLTMRFFQSEASKFEDDDDAAAAYAHLNVDFKSALPEDGEGIFAELGGVREISEATKALLKPKLPRGASSLV